MVLRKTVQKDCQVMLKVKIILEGYNFLVNLHKFYTTAEQ